MKKITFLLAVLITAFGFSQTVVQDFEDGDGPYGPFGGGAGSVVANPSVDADNGSANVAQVVATAGQQVWQGINISIDQNVEVYTGDPTMTLDVYSTTPISILVKVTASTDSGPDSATSVTHTGSGWETLTATFDTGLDGTAPADGTYSNFVVYPNWDPSGPGYIDPSIDRTVYVDNIAGTVPTGPTCSDGIQNGDETGVDCGGSVCDACPAEPTTAPPTPPARDPGDVISIYGDAYGTEVGLNNVPWDGSDFTEETYAANDLLEISFGGGFMGSGLGTVTDATAMTHFHMDYFIADAYSAGMVFNLKWSNHTGGAGETNAGELTIALPGDGTQNQTWVSVDVPLTDWTAGISPREALTEFLITTQAGTAYIDNIYFHNNQVLSTDQFETAEFSVFPNPTNNDWNINGNSEITKLALFDILGKEVLSIAPNSNEVTIDATSFKTGVYFARIEGVNGTKTVKLIRQ
ncbi:T9SS type A sorting domain-containing protein [Winogradskyella poriferorum]|uniref:T9SS type A sorting domain-containing protein n=1 Tax=Winogradskyella poriferorum TaxID=307627 RepID=UPI003D64B872